MIKVKDYSKCIKSDRKKINLNVLAPQVEYRMCVVGPSNSGKTNMVVDLILNHVHFDKLYVFAKDLEEPLYEFLKDFFNKCKQVMERKTDTEIQDIAFFSNKLEDLPNIDEVDKRKQHLIIFDDFVTERHQECIEDIFVRSRKKGFSTIYISQSWFDIPKIVRLNSDYFALFNIGNKKELRSIADSHSTKIEFNVFMELYREIMKTPYSFMLIDKKTKKLPMHIRNGWSGLLDDKSLFDLD